ncbi:MAG: DNA or RNA helicase of superfamily II [Aquipseudomonas alcaligenes]|uniref:DNA or RNA helicase of superfamily II n=1 Tax=Aquipseudomonas alcaligenes TaxID=43263 RepID=A0A5C7VVX5_AQUAC|nr:MAG: DNA or RNA helicase of superfamily II [Pseudomonas alcaligenes]
MHHPPAPSNQTRCPRCGHPNHCAQAGHAQPVQDCWCFHTTLPAGTLEQRPADTRCLCPACLRALAGPA